MNHRSITEIVRDAERNYLMGSVKISKYVNYSMHDIINTIDAYLNSKHISGETDAQGREKPFFNIVTAAVNIWFRATDLDRKDVTVRATESDQVVEAFVATIMLQEWMRKNRFGTFLNDWGIALARYGSCVVKFVEKNGELIPSVIPWNRLIVDSIDFDSLPRIEKIYITPDQLRQKTEYDQEQVKNLIESQVTRKTLDKQQQDTQNKFIELYEVHGELPIALLEDDPMKADEKLWDTYRQQMHVVSFTATRDGYKDYTLYKGIEAKDPYMKTDLIKEDGRTLSIGAVEYLFDSQWMQNHSVKVMKDTLDLASRLIFQTADTNYVGRNVLSAIETGDIMIHAENKPLTQINNAKPDITAMQNFGNQWLANARELTSTPDALRGTTLPSGTPYSLGALLSQNASSLFEVMTENKGLALEDMLRTFVLPFFKKSLNNNDEVVALLDEHNLRKFDTMFLPELAVQQYNEQFKQDVLKGSVPSPYQADIAQAQVQDQMQKFGNMRSISSGDVNWKEVFKNLEWDLEVNVTNETIDKQVALTSLSTALQTIATNPMILNDPNAKLIFGKIISLAGGISPLELQNSPAQASPPDALPANTPVNGTSAG